MDSFGPEGLQTVEDDDAQQAENHDEAQGEPDGGEPDIDFPQGAFGGGRKAEVLFHGRWMDGRERDGWFPRR